MYLSNLAFKKYLSHRWLIYGKWLRVINVNITHPDIVYKCQFSNVFSLGNWQTHNKHVWLASTRVSPSPTTIENRTFRNFPMQFQACCKVRRGRCADIVLLVITIIISKQVISFSITYCASVDFNHQLSIGVSHQLQMEVPGALLSFWSTAIKPYVHQASIYRSFELTYG